MKENNKSNARKRTTKILRDVFALFLWSYAIVKLFVLDFDVYLIQRYTPSFSWLVHFKFALFLTLVSIYWLTVGNKNFFKMALFLALFPFYLLFWRIGRLVFRNWFATLAATGYVGSFLKSLKFNFVTFTLFFVATLLVIASGQRGFIILGMALLGVYLIIHFSRRFYYAFVPSKALIFPRQGFIWFLGEIKKQFALPQEIKSTAIERFRPDQKSKWETHLQLLLLANRGTTFIASKLRKFQESRLIILYFIFGLLFTFLATVALFAIVNLGLHKIDPRAFSDASPKGILFFLYYSLNTILTNSVADFYPISPVSRLLNTAEIFMGFVIIVILFFMYTNIKGDKAKTEMDSLVTSLEKQGSELEIFINQEFSMDITQAMAEVEKLPGNFIKIIYYFTSRKTKE